MILLPAGCLGRIVAAAERSYPDECCGLLVGSRERDGVLRVSDVVESANVAPPPRHRRFEIDPAVRFALIRRLRNSPLQEIGHYHSHPDGTPLPSSRDREAAFEANLVWLIVAVTAGVAGDPAAFLPDSPMAGFHPLPLTIIG